VIAHISVAGLPSQDGAANRRTADLPVPPVPWNGTSGAVGPC